jgi:hypothetical protein
MGIAFIQIRGVVREVTETDEEKCSPKIDVTLGFGSCDAGTYVKGVDKPSDLDSEFRQ